MNIQVTKKFLHSALQKLTRIVPPRSNNPVLSYVRLTPTHKGFTLEGTNTEIDLNIFVPAQIDAGESIIVPCHLLAQIVSNLPGELVEIQKVLTSGDIKVSSGSANYKLQVGDKSAFPEFTAYPCTATIKGPEFKAALTRTAYSIATEAFQQVFRSHKLEFTDQYMRVVASDGFRLAYHQTEAIDLKGNYLLPGKSAKEIVHFIDNETELKLGASNINGTKIITVEGATWKATCKLMDGEFPDYDRIIPTSNVVSITLPAHKLKDAITRVAVLADKNANNRVELLIQENRLTLIAEGDYGRANEVLEVQQTGTEPAISLGFNAKFLSDALSGIEGDVTLQLSGVTTPAVIRPSGSNPYLAVVVPLRI